MNNRLASKPVASLEPTDLCQPRELEKPSDSPSRAILKAVLWLIVFLIVQSLIAVPGSFLVGQAELTAAIAASATFFAALMIVRLKHGADWRRAMALLSFSWPHALLVLLLIPVTLVVVAMLGTGLEAAYKAVGVSDEMLAGHAQLGDLFAGLAAMPPILAVFFIAVFFGLLPGLGEELYFRGFLGHRLLASPGAVGGILMTSILFGIMHFHPVQSVVAAFYGVVFHVIFLWSRSLWISGLFHATNNMLMGLTSFIPDQYGPQWVMNGNAPPWSLLATTPLAFLAMIWLFQQMRVRWILADGSVWSPGYAATEAPPADSGALPLAGRPSAFAWLAVATTYVAFVAACVSELLR